MNLDIINLSLNHLPRAARWTSEILWKGRLMDGMDKFTVLKSSLSTIGHDEGKINTSKKRFLIISDYMNQSVAPKFAPTLPL